MHTVTQMLIQNHTLHSQCRYYSHASLEKLINLLHPNVCPKTTATILKYIKHNSNAMDLKLLLKYTHLLHQKIFKKQLQQS